MGQEDGASSSEGTPLKRTMANDAGKPPLPSALEMVLRRLSIVDGHRLACSCPACIREGDARKNDPPFVMLELGQGAA